jgi:hypothetical protein
MAGTHVPTRGGSLDARHFDAVVRLLSEAGTRRGLLGLLAALPIVSGLFALRDADGTKSQGRRMRRKKRHKHGKGRHQGSGKNKKKKLCRAEPSTTTCAGRCGTVKNNCQKSVDCGACTCDSPCPSGCCSEDGSCQPGTSDNACGASGNCVDCGSGRRCLQSACVCDSESCADGCCDAQGQCLPDSDFSCGTGGVACTGSCADDGAAPGLDSEESALLPLLNAFRVAEGRTVLAPNALLAAAADAHALDMATRGYFSDIDPDGDGPSERVISQGYDPDLVVEIRAGGHRTAAQAFDAWQISPGHAAIMLDPEVIEIGIGRAVKPDTEYRWYWSVNFASPAQE